MVIPLSMMVAVIGMHLWGVSGNLLSLGALDFGIIVDGAVIVVEQCVRRLSIRQQAAGQRLTSAQRAEEVTAASVDVLRPAVFGQVIIMIVYVPILTLTGVEGRMFTPMAFSSGRCDGRSVVAVRDVRPGGGGCGARRPHERARESDPPLHGPCMTACWISASITASSS